MVSVMVILLPALVSAACLKDETLNALGFEKLLSKPEKDSDVCTDLHSKYGACVDQDEIKEVMEEENKLLKESYGIGNDATNLLGDTIKEMQELFATHPEGNDEIKARIIFLNIYFNDIKKNLTPCLEALANLQRGFICYATSAKASENTIDTDETLTVKVLRSSINNLDSCTRIFTGLCAVSDGPGLFRISIDGKSPEGESDFTTKNGVLLERCRKYTDISGCDFNQIANCKNAEEGIAEAFFTYGDYDVYPTEEDVETFRTELNAQLAEMKFFLEKGGKVEDLTKLFDNEDTQIASGLKSGGAVELEVMEEGEGGANLQEHGHKSSVEFENIQIFKTFLYLSLIWLSLF